MLKGMNKNFFLFLIFISASCTSDMTGPTTTCLYTPAAETTLHPKNGLYESLLSKYVKQGLPGIILLVKDPNGTWVGSKGMADIDKGIAIEPCHISKAASITKMFVAVTAMQLVEENVLALDEKASKWLKKDVVSRIKNAESVTLRQLLNHTTGIYDIIDDSKFYLAILNDPTKKRSLEELAEFVYDKDPEFEPGEKAAYSNTNTLLVSMILENVTGRPHQELVRERIFVPLDLQNSFYLDFKQLPSFTVQGYYDLFNNNTIVNLSNYNTASGYGGLYSSVFDLLKFIEALLVEKTLLSQSSLDEMLQFDPEVENRKLLGTGIFKDFIDFGENNFAYGHRGRDLAYSADLFYFPHHNTTMVMLLNYGTDAETKLRSVFYEFRDELAEIIIQP
jgi:D-alanyl-D-alanine carboxypeptidase